MCFKLTKLLSDTAVSTGRWGLESKPDFKNCPSDKNRQLRFQNESWTRVYYVPMLEWRGESLSSGLRLFYTSIGFLTRTEILVQFIQGSHYGSLLIWERLPDSESTGGRPSQAII